MKELKKVKTKKATELSQFEMDLSDFDNGVSGSAMSVDSQVTPKAIWNLILSKRDLGLWRRGMRPHRHWRVSDVKRYFGLKGNKDKIYEDICKMVNTYLPPSK